MIVDFSVGINLKIHFCIYGININNFCLLAIFLQKYSIIALYRSINNIYFRILKTLNKGDLSLKKFLFLSGTALLLLSACNNGDSSSDSKGASKVEDTQKSEDSKNRTILSHHQVKESSNQSSKSKQSSTNDISNLSEKEKLALVFLANESGEYAITKNDILTGRYTTQTSDGKKQKN